MRSDSADQKKDRHGMVNMYDVVPAKIMLYISIETRPATQSLVAEVEPCSTSAFWRAKTEEGDRDRRAYYHILYIRESYNTTLCACTVNVVYACPGQGAVK